MDSRHEDKDVAAMTVLNVPGGQFRQLSPEVAPWLEENLPAAQACEIANIRVRHQQKVSILLCVPYIVQTQNQQNAPLDKCCIMMQIVLNWMHGLRL